MKPFSLPLTVRAVLALTLAVALCLCLVGGVLTQRSAEMPPVSDTAAFATLMAKTPPALTSNGNDAGAYKAYKQKWFADRDALLTNKYPLHDRGIALIALGLTLVAAVALLWLTKVESPNDLRTPKSRLLLVLLGPATLVLTVIAMFARWGEWHERALDPYWADSAVAETFAALIAAVILPVMLIVGWWLTRKTKLPAGLANTEGLTSALQTRPFRFGPTITILAGELLWALLALIVLDMTLSSLWQGNYLDVPLGFVWFYLVLVGRALTTAAPPSPPAPAQAPTLSDAAA